MELFMVIHLSYFINDIFCLEPIYGTGRLTRETQIHHLVGIIGLGSAIFLGRIIGIIALSLMITELSTIFLNNRSIMKQL